ncbi:MAG TPA: right-handed parallel beta-helix repeat-containing protein [Anaerolineaceae bacterium]
MPVRIGELLNGRYLIDSVLGKGGMGMVYQAFDSLHDQPCAVKEFRLSALPSEREISNGDDLTRPRLDVLPSQMSREKAAEQFKQEARLLARLSHPNLPQVTDYFTINNDYYIVMTLIQGQDLASVMQEANFKPLPQNQVMNWLYQVMDALEYCHQTGVIHRDVKPGNIIITPSGTIFLVDFGISKQNDPLQATITAARAATAGYSPPEQYGMGGSPEQRTHTDQRSDIYALGATIYALLTGRDPVSVIDRMIGKELTAPHAINPTVSPAVSNAVLKAMALKPADRFQSIAELRAALKGNTPAPTDLTQKPVEKLGETTPINLMNLTVGKKGALTLEEAVQVCLPGSVINLPPGEYALFKPLLIQKAIHLQGSGMNTTRIFSTCEGAVSVFSGGGPFKIEGIAFQHVNERPAEVVVIESSQAEITDCRFSGGKEWAGFANTGAGLRLAGNARVTIRDSQFLWNTGSGILLCGKSDGILQENLCQENNQNGICFLEQAGGNAAGNQCTRNGWNGIECRSGGAVNITGNLCQTNRQNGIACLTGRCQATRNECRTNEQNGIRVAGTAQPTLDHNFCQANRQNGILFQENSAGQAYQNQCDDNGLHGIAVLNQAAPLLSTNVCRSNHQSGIACLEHTAARLSANTCENNDYHGIGVQGLSKPEIDENQCIRNKWDGIAFFDRSCGSARRNTCTSNGHDGISVNENAAPQIFGNLCTNNHQNGIAIFGQAGGVIEGNTCTGNQGMGIFRVGTARPVIRINDLSGNRL